MYTYITLKSIQEEAKKEQKKEGRHRGENMEKGKFYVEDSFVCVLRLLINE